MISLNLSNGAGDKYKAVSGVYAHLTNKPSRHQEVDSPPTNSSEVIDSVQITPRIAYLHCKIFTFSLLFSSHLKSTQMQICRSLLTNRTSRVLHVDLDNANANNTFIGSMNVNFDILRD